MSGHDCPTCGTEMVWWDEPPEPAPEGVGTTGTVYCAWDRCPEEGTTYEVVRDTDGGLYLTRRALP